MVKQRNEIRSFALYIGDLLATGLAFLFAYGFRGGFPEEYYASLFPLSWYLNLLWPILLVWSLIFYLMELYRFWKGPGFWQEAWNIFKAVVISSLLLGFIVFALKFQFVSRIFILSFAFFNILTIIIFRFTIRQIIIFLNRQRDNFRLILVVGINEQTLKMVRGIEKQGELGLRILGFLSTNESPVSPQLIGYPVLGKAEDLPQVLEKEVVDEVIFALTQEEIKKMENLFLICEERGITTRIILNFFPHTISKTYLVEFDGFPLLTFTTTPKNELLLFSRRIFDFVGSIIFIILFSPLFLLITLLIKTDSRGPALYRQIRCGLNGRKFTFYKFRSMIEKAEEKKNELSVFNQMNGPVFKMKDDPRITRMGRILRRTSLDELPQLFNVLKGDMSFVGPRPPLPEEVEKYEGWQRRRLSMKPGITGLWQVSGRNQIDFDRWMKLDLEYIDNWSLWLDFKILLKTIPVVLSGKGAM